MFSRLCRQRLQPIVTPKHLTPPWSTARFKRYQAFDAELDQEGLAESRSWLRTFEASQLPKGSTSYARSSGPGGQHVNKTETKAITSYSVRELQSVLPKILHPGIRLSKYYTTGNDCLTFTAQTQRSRTANADENREKLVDEVMRIYHERTPSETSKEKRKKHEQVEKRFHEARIQQKKTRSAKKKSRKGPLG